VTAFDVDTATDDGDRVLSAERRLDEHVLDIVDGIVIRRVRAFRRVVDACDVVAVKKRWGWWDR